jgi:hypothetical protein
VALPAGLADTDLDREARDVAPDVGADEVHVTFVDVPRSHWAWRHVEAAYASGVTGGCATGPLRFCPDAAVTRAQDAVLLLRGKLGPAYTPPPAVGRFQDVPPTDLFAPWVEDLAARGVTGGCSVDPPLFCPGQSVTRAQMAVFLLATDEGPSYTPPPAAGIFADLPASSPFAAWAEELARRGVTGGCGVNPLRFCPAQPVTRAQAAVLLVSAFELPLP